MTSNDRFKDIVPAYFSVVMATGIMGIAFHLMNWQGLSQICLFLNGTLFTFLIITLLYRLAVSTRQVLSDFHSYKYGPSFLTIIPAFFLIANQIFLVTGAASIAKILLVIAGIIWLFLAYGLFFFLTLTAKKERMEHVVDGSWLLFIVAIQALSVLTNVLSEGSHQLLFISLAMFSIGVLFYLYIMSFIFYRMSFFNLDAQHLGAPYWINMGSTAITSLAASMLILSAEEFPLLRELLPFLKGLAILFWAVGTWWIPLLVIFGIWKHVIKRIKLPLTADGYQTSYWSLVFPLGMYAVCTFRLAEASGLTFLASIPKYFVFIVIIAWLSVITGLVRSIYLKLVINKEHQ